MNQHGWRRKLIDSLKKYKLNSILVRNFVLITLMITLPLVIIVMIVKYHLDNIVQQEIQEMNQLALERTAETMDSIIDQVFSFSYYLAGDDELGLLGLYNYEQLQAEYSDFMAAKVRLHVKIHEYIDSVYIYMEEDQYLIDYTAQVISLKRIQDVEDVTWMPAYHAMGDEIYVLHSRKKDGAYPYLLSLITSVKECGGGFEGAIVVNLNMKSLGKQLGYTTKDKQMFLMIGDDRKLLFTNRLSWVADEFDAPSHLDFLLEKENMQALQELEGEEYFVSVTNSNKKRWSYVFCNPMTLYLEQMEQVDMLVLMLTIMSCVIGMLVSYIVTLHSYRPLQYILYELEKPDESDYMIAAELTENYVSVEDVGGGERNELQYISNMVRSTRLRNNRLQMETEEWMKKLNHSQMYVLQSQINPHYLYNTLDAINWDAVEQLGEGNSVSDMLTTLAQFLRISLQRSNYLISIEEELEHAKLYGKIIKARYAGSIVLQWDVDPKIMQYKMIRLSLQPLLENAVNHGLRKKRYVGNIRICAYLLENMVVLYVEDDGKGMSIEECRSLNQELLNDYETDSKHVGIRNVNQRMKILFGDEYGVNVMCREEGGLMVRLLFPKMQ